METICIDLTALAPMLTATARGQHHLNAAQEFLA
jgi:hypothetical protein